MGGLPGMPWAFLPWPFDRTYMQLALLAGVVVGATAPLIGVFLVQKGLSLMGDGIGHVAVAGIGASLLLDTSPTWTALVVAVAAALVIEFLRTRGSATGDLALALVFYGGIAAGVVIIAKSPSSSPANLTAYLFGAITTADQRDLWVFAGLALVVLLATWLLRPWLFAVANDEEYARASGLPVTGLKMVPEPNRSPLRIDAPLTVRWASICIGDQYRSRYSGRETTVSFHTTS
jgi:zinc transport system permease protein